MSDELFRVRDISKHFQGVKAVDGVSLEIAANEVRGIIGPNGAGKTTLFNLISGITQPDRGEVLLRGKNLVGLPPHRVCREGLARTFQNIMLMRQLTVLENVLVGQFSRTETKAASILLGTVPAKGIEKKARDVALQALEYVGLADRRDDTADSLPYGQQRLLEIARALATEPTILLLDEPAAGMNPTEKAELMHMVQKIRDSGITVAIIEHDMRVIMNICDKITVLDFGQKIAEGTPEEVRSNRRVLDAYLGRG
jgi:branched-chain amino acid transport system ATP-binding protein